MYLQFPHAFWEKSDDWEPTNARFKSREAPGESDDEETQEEYERRREQYFRWIERSHVPGTEFSYWDPCYNYPYQKPVSWYRWHAEGAEGAYQFIINEHLALTKQPILVLETPSRRCSHFEIHDFDMSIIFYDIFFIMLVLVCAAGHDGRAVRHHPGHVAH